MQFLEEVDKLIKMLQESMLLKDYQSFQKEVLEDEELLQAIEQYHQGDFSLKKKILENERYQSYQKKSQELSLLIWRMNVKFQNLKGDFACGLSKENIKDAS